MASIGKAARKELDMPDSLFREDAGVILSIIGFLYAVLAGVVGWISKRIAKLRDHDEDIRRLTAMQSDTAELLACIRADHSTEVHERRDEESKIYARIEANSVRYDTKVDEIKDSLHDLGLRVERAIKGD